MIGQLFFMNKNQKPSPGNDYIEFYMPQFPKSNFLRKMGNDI